MRSRVCLTLAWLLLLVALAVGNPWLPPRTAMVGAAAAPGGEAALGEVAPSEVSPGSLAVGLGWEDAPDAGGLASDPARDPASESGLESAPLTGN